MANTSVIWLGIGMIIGGLMAIILGGFIIISFIRYLKIIHLDFRQVFHK